jgi:flagellar hook-basal body complex protein FliE
MSIQPIVPVEAITDVARAAQSGQSSQVNFSDWVSDQINTTDIKIAEAENQVQRLALGEADNLHQVMIALSSAKTSFELTVQVRNKLLEGFQQVMRMSI